LRYCELGLGDHIGIHSGQWQPVGTVEMLAGENNTLRATSKYFVGCPSASFQVDPDIQVLSRLHDFSGQEIGAASFVDRRNQHRVAVLGHLPEARLLRPARKRQWSALGAELSAVSSPQIETEYPIVQWVRVDAAGAPRILILWNACFDEARDIKIRWENIDLQFSTANARWSDSQDHFILPAWGVAVFTLSATQAN